LCAARAGHKILKTPEGVFLPSALKGHPSPISFAQVVENYFENLRQSRDIPHVSVGNIVGNAGISALFPKNEQTPLKSHENPTDVHNFSTFSEKFSTDTTAIAGIVPCGKVHGFCFNPR
jgi:hypothetical protein